MKNKGASGECLDSHTGRPTRRTGLNRGERRNAGRSQAPIRCPKCGSDRIWRNGHRFLKDGRKIQRYLCRTCSFRFIKHMPNPEVEFNVGCKVPKGSDPRDRGAGNLRSNRKLPFQDLPDDLPLTACKDVGSHDFTVIGENFIKLFPYSRNRRVGASAGEAKNLAKVEPRTESGLRGATERDVKSLLFNFSWWMKKQGYAEQTIESRTKLLRILVRRGADLYDPESVKEVIAKQKWSEGRKENAVLSYSTFLKMTGGKWDPPRYRKIDKLPWIPTEQEVDQLIAGCSPRVATFLQLLKETGMRPGEAWNLRWIDVDYERNTVTVTPEKGSNPRIFKLSGKLIAMLKSLPVKNDYVFRSGILEHFSNNFRRQRIRVAYKLKNPRINRITFKTLRHFKATMEYAKTKDILHVKEILGHKNIKNTLKYTHLVNFETDEFVSKTAKTVEEAQRLIEAGFEYVCDFDGVKLFRKRK